MTTNTVKHTPGPWTAEMSKYHEESLLVKAGMPSNRVLARFGSASEPLDDTDRANARLIAAAPDLLEALREAEAGLEFAGADIDIPEGDFVPSPTLSLRAVRAAIAKAEAR